MAGIGLSVVEMETDYRCGGSVGLAVNFRSSVWQELRTNFPFNSSNPRVMSTNGSGAELYGVGQTMSRLQSANGSEHLLVMRA